MKFDFKTFYQLVKYLISRKGYRKKWKRDSPSAEEAKKMKCYRRLINISSLCGYLVIFRKVSRNFIVSSFVYMEVHIMPNTSTHGVMNITCRL